MRALLAALLCLAALGLPAAAWADPPRPAARAQPASVAPVAPVAPAQAADGVVNINTASAEELERVPGIGPSRAESIVRLRERVTRFRAVDDLVRVRGIGRATLRRMRPFLTLNGPTTLAERPGRARREAAE